MIASGLFSKFCAAFCLSVAALLGNVAIQGAVLFRRQVVDSSAPPICNVSRLSLGADDAAALAVVQFFPQFPSTRSPYRVAGVFDVRAAHPKLKPIDSQLSPWVAGTASRNGYGFLGTQNGELYLLDLADRLPKVAFLGKHSVT